MVSNSRSCIIIAVVIDRKLRREGGKKSRVVGGTAQFAEFAMKKGKSGGGNNIVLGGQNRRRVSREGGERLSRGYSDTFVFLSERSSSERRDT